MRLVGLLVCDFDETITQDDSLCELAGLAYEKRAKTGKCPELLTCPNDNGEQCPPWSYFVELYFKEYKEHIKSWRDRNPDNTLKDHYEMLESLKEVENISIDRVEKYGCLKDVYCNELIERGKLLKKRDNALNVLKKFISKQNSLLEDSTFERNLYILSANWSKDLILGSLFELLLENFDEKSIFSNDLIFNNDNCSIGKLNRRILCALDKLEIFNRFNKPKGTLSVYIGDSITDLACLLRADVGIIMGNNRTLTKCCEKYGIEIVEGLTNCDFDDMYSERKNKKLYRVQDWNEISDSRLLD